MAELEALTQQYFPSAPPQLAEQGRGGVTTSPVYRDARYDNLETGGALRIGAPDITSYRYWEQHRVCPICGKVFDREGTRKKHCSDACKQKAYRQRKKTKQVAA